MPEAGLIAPCSDTSAAATHSIDYVATDNSRGDHRPVMVVLH